MSKTLYFDGQKSVDMSNPAIWNILAGDMMPQDVERLYAVVSHLYRCVALRANAVASMPFTLLQGKKEIAVWTGTDFEEDLPDKMKWLNSLNDLLAKTEAASCLVGSAYWERRKNMSGTRDLFYRWLLPSSIEEAYNGVPGIGRYRYDPALPMGQLMGFYRRLPYLGNVIDLEIDDLVYFWLPDHTVELGPAKVTPGRAVLQNVGVIHNMDVFLSGYFERGLIKATLLKYKDNISPTEAGRLKEWWRRVMSGVKNSHATEIIRGDFETMTIGEGIKDLRDNVLSRDEKEAIGTGMGVPLSKLNSTSATDSNRNADEVSFIEDTIIPEIGWIYQILNDQIFYPMGMRIKANPDTLRVMQEDETQRATAWASYVNAGMSLPAATAILGIDVPEGVELEPEPKPIPPMLQPFTGQDSRSPLQEGIEEKILSEFKSLESYLDKRLSVIENGANFATVAIFDLIDKHEEKRQFERWLKNRDYVAIKVDDFGSQYLSHDDKLEIAIKAIQSHTPYKATKIDKLQSDYADQLAAFIEGAIDNDLSQDAFIRGMRDVVYAGLLTVFKSAAGVPDGEKLTSEEMDKFNNALIKELERVDNYARDLYAGLGKGARFNRVKESLQQLSGNLGGRLTAWANAARLVFNQGAIWGRGESETKMKWGFGATEKHCTDCLFYNGQTKTRQEWQELAGVLIYPQSRALACKGYNCDCSISEI